MHAAGVYFSTSRLRQSKIGVLDEQPPLPISVVCVYTRCIYLPTYNIYIYFWRANQVSRWNRLEVLRIFASDIDQCNC